ncbi:hypothetical protein C8R44DRAFT_859272 [Mycena epipterygia]|nr:hypothetical protein C8R44DRAFT_859272 [Mycena epipterygia]
MLPDNGASGSKGGVLSTQHVREHGWGGPEQQGVETPALEDFGGADICNSSWKCEWDTAKNAQCCKQGHNCSGNVKLGQYAHGALSGWAGADEGVGDGGGIHRQQGIQNKIRWSWRFGSQGYMTKQIFVRGHAPLIACVLCSALSFATCPSSRDVFEILSSSYCRASALRRTWRLLHQVGLCAQHLHSLVALTTKIPMQATGQEVEVDDKGDKGRFGRFGLSSLLDAQLRHRVGRRGGDGCTCRDGAAWLDCIECSPRLQAVPMYCSIAFSTSKCVHVFVGGAEHTVVKLPTNYGRRPYSADKLVYLLKFDYDFSGIPDANGPIYMHACAIASATILPALNFHRRHGHARLLGQYHRVAARAEALVSGFRSAGWSGGETTRRGSMVWLSIEHMRTSTVGLNDTLLSARLECKVKPSKPTEGHGRREDACIFLRHLAWRQLRVSIGAPDVEAESEMQRGNLLQTIS